MVKLAIMFLRLFGFKGYSAHLALNALKKDLSNKKVPFKTKIWAWKKGFTSSRVFTYNINESNYRNHIPDFDYYKLHPINGIYSRWIDDKLTMKYILAPFNEYLPEYYFQICGDEILRLTDCPKIYQCSVDGIVNLLKDNTNLALKPLAGSLGEGFYRLIYKDNSYYINTKKVDEDELKEFIKNLSGYLVTEYIIAHDEIRKIYNATPNTLRIQLTRDSNKRAKITGAFIRFGTKKSGVLETPLAGGIFANVMLQDGLVNEAYRLNDNILVKINNHPDTDQKFDFFLPNWDLICRKVVEISQYLPQLRYIGFDIVITNNKFKILEINSLTATTVLPFFYPILSDQYNEEFFVKLFKKRPRTYKRVLRAIKSI